MTFKNSKTEKTIAVAVFIVGTVLLLSIVLLLKWYIGLSSIVVLSVAGFFIWNKLQISTKRYLSENIFTLLTGIAAVSIIIFVLYLLLHIFMLGKGSLSFSFLFSDPKEGLTEGGIFPAIVGTALLVIIMSIVGVPVGTITAIYLTEYAKESSKIARFIRFAVNTLAGVPAVVFGLFGLGFFIGVVGKNMDIVENNSKINKLEILFKSEASPFNRSGKASGEDIRMLLQANDEKYWSSQISQANALEEINGKDGEISKNDALNYFRDNLGPHWQQPALIWAALTMALLTLPVVIVSVEEAIRTVPKDLREASLALGATKFMTIMKVVLPGSITGIMTGGILAVSRGAGEVAPILFTGAAYYLPDLPNSLSSQFMELGYHIYVLTTQSTNIELTKPLLYATTLVLLLLTFLLNFTAIFLRSKVRAKLAKLS
jgi:ABC-type phosphate transport system permease subunit